MTAPGRPAATPLGVLLDADDTLYDTRAAMHAAGAQVAAELWPEADPARIAGAGVRFRDDPEGHFGAYTRGEVEYDEMRRARVAELAGWLGQRHDDLWWHRFDALYEPAFLGALTAFDDVRPVVDELRAAGLAVGVLTNSSATYTAAKLRAAGLSGVFDVVCTRDTLGFGKPDARAFHAACDRLGTAPEATLYVGDEVVNDPVGASDAGLAAVWLVREGEPEPHDGRLLAGRGVPVIASLTEVPRLLARPGARFGVGESAR
ncbi:HAD family hydrolase [Phycicoccus duodecadis]|uniref:Putative hydrolase of the HAD superfamily n=1 Tax=Phycicoccus duodecadis TaxID=173053 RepID=A0A2N3YGC9_9MICO|nr:HAD family hydrolase [Phycicoccus duodecadis]PKW25914.1 putative hydrolase of the HAD superfamily [Phycicoccus duodecadis]